MTLGLKESGKAPVVKGRGQKRQGQECPRVGDPWAVRSEAGGTGAGWDETGRRGTGRRGVRELLGGETRGGEGEAPVRGLSRRFWCKGSHVALPSPGVWPRASGRGRDISSCLHAGHQYRDKGRKRPESLRGLPPSRSFPFVCLLGFFRGPPEFSDKEPGSRSENET